MPCDHTPFMKERQYAKPRPCSIAQGSSVWPIPGASALLAALVVAGLPTDRFFFQGFLPAKAAARRSVLAELAAVPATLVVYEAPHRLAEALADAAEVLGPRPAAVCRELTKTHEEVLRGPLAELAAWAEEGPVRGEITVVLGGAEPSAAPSVESLVDAVHERVADGERLKDAVSAVAAAAGVPKRELYNAALARP